MAFFDQKQEVIKVELTTYGRYLLSLGKLRPSMYAFYDDDVIYDSSYHNTLNSLPEDQNEIEDRILKGSLRRHPQTNFSGVETSIKRQKRQKGPRSGTEIVAGTSPGLFGANEQHEVDRGFSLGMPLGKTSVYNDAPPAFRLMTLAGEINSSASSMEDEVFGNSYRIPQIDIDIEYDITAHFTDKESKDSLRAQAEKRSRHVTFSSPFGDGSYLKIEGKHILMSLEEKNVDITGDSFEVEVFEETTEVVRIPRRDENGNVYVAREKRINYVPIQFDPYTNALVSANESAAYNEFYQSEAGSDFSVEENLNEPLPDSVESIFTINADAQLSVPVDILAEATQQPLEVANMLSQRSSTFLSKPLLRIPLSRLQLISAADGPLSAAEIDIYSTGLDLSGDYGEECDDDPSDPTGSGGYM